MGIPYLEYACMPIGELSDLYDFFCAQEGHIELVDKRDTEFIPEAR